MPAAGRAGEALATKRGKAAGKLLLGAAKRKGPQADPIVWRGLVRLYSVGGT